jgi:hypothetical protein
VPTPSLWYLDSEVNIAAIDEPMFAELEMIAPFGRGNPNPYFLSRNIAFNPQENNSDGDGDEYVGSIDGLPVAASKDVAERWQLRGGVTSQRYDVIYQISTSERNTPHLIIRDLRHAGRS